MERSSVTPTKRFETATAARTAYQELAASSHNVLEHSVLRDFDGVKGIMKGVETHNRHLLEEIERIKIERDLLESKLIQELGYKEETLLRFQNEKNFQMDQFQLQAEEEILRVKRECAAEVDAVIRQMRVQEQQLREVTDTNKILQNKNADLNRQLNQLQKELIKAHEVQIELTHKSTLVNAQNEKVKDEMEQEIRVLLQIEAEKSDNIEALQLKLSRSEASEKHLMEKLESLSAAFEQLDTHIKIFTEKLAAKETQNLELKNIMDKMEIQAKARQRELLSLSELNNSIRKQCEESVRREKIRESEIKELIAENERLYAEVNIQRHRIHDLAATYGFAI